MGSDWRIRPSAVEAATDAATAVITGDAASVRSHLEYVLDGQAGPLEAEQRRVLENAWRSSRRLAKLAEDLRDVALAETNQLEPALADCDVAGLLGRAIAQAWPVASAGKKTLDLDAGDHATVLGDAELVGRALAAVVEHAVEHATPATAITVRVRADGVEVAFETDDAPASDPLGLALASAFAKLHGGGLAVQAAEGRAVLTLSFGPSPDPAEAAGGRR